MNYVFFIAMFFASQATQAAVDPVLRCSMLMAQADSKKTVKDDLILKVEITLSADNNSTKNRLVGEKNIRFEESRRSGKGVLSRYGVDLFVVYSEFGGLSVTSKILKFKNRKVTSGFDYLGTVVASSSKELTSAEYIKVDSFSLGFVSPKFTKAQETMEKNKWGLAEAIKNKLLAHGDLLMVTLSNCRLFTK